MKIPVLSTLLISLVASIPLGGNAKVNTTLGGSSGDTGVRQFKAALYMFAPETWMTSWNAVPEEAQKCFIKTVFGPASFNILDSNGVEWIKQNLQSNCSVGATELGNFVDIVEQAAKTLPAGLLNIVKFQMKNFREEYNQLAPDFARQDTSKYKEKLSQFTTLVANFIDQLAELPDADREQIAAMFPKIQPFVSGDHATELLKQLASLYSTVAEPDSDSSAIKSQGEQVKSVLKVVWQHYSAQNAENVGQASLLVGKDLKQFDELLSLQSKSSKKDEEFALLNMEHVTGRRSQAGNETVQSVLKSGMSKLGAIKQDGYN